MAANLVVFADLANKAGESLVDIYALLGRCLDEDAAEVLREVAALCMSMSKMTLGRDEA